jgi:anaerobic selenocysteine-containing dehydrogenase
MLSHRDAALLGLADGDEALIAVAHATGQWRASVVVRAGFPEGIAGLPSGLPGLETVTGGKIDVRKVPL